MNPYRTPAMALVATKKTKVRSWWTQWWRNRQAAKLRKEHRAWLDLKRKVAAHPVSLTSHWFQYVQTRGRAYRYSSYGRIKAKAPWVEELLHEEAERRFVMLHTVFAHIMDDAMNHPKT